MKYKSFEELPVWRDSIKIGKEIYLLTNSGKFEKDCTLKDQVRRAVISISSNIAEGFERSNNNEFVRFLLIAKGSLGEVRSQLYLAFILGYIENSILEEVKDELGFISYLKKEKAGGNFSNK